MLVIVVTTLTARSVEMRSVYEVRLTGEEVAPRMTERDGGGQAGDAPAPK